MSQCRDQIDGYFLDTNDTNGHCGGVLMHIISYYYTIHCVLGCDVLARKVLWATVSSLSPLCFAISCLGKMRFSMILRNFDTFWGAEVLLGILSRWTLAFLHGR